MDLGTGFTAALTWTGNVGPAFGNMGGFDSFAALPAFAKLFGNDLKLDYQPESRDRLLEQIVRQYEKGLL